MASFATTRALCCSLLIGILLSMALVMTIIPEWQMNGTYVHTTVNGVNTKTNTTASAPGPAIGDHYVRFAIDSSSSNSTATDCANPQSVVMTSRPASRRGLKFCRAVVTGASDNHHLYLYSFLKDYEQNGAHLAFPLIVYNLGGLNEDKYRIAFPWIMDIRRFNYSKYPEHVDIGHASGQYAWKSAIIKEMLDMTALDVFWLDSESRLKSLEELHAAFDTIHAQGVYSPSSSGNVLKWVHPGTLKALGAGAELNTKTMCNAAIVGVSAWHATAYHQVVEPWFKCSMEKACIAPEGSSRANHRQDQAVLTVLMYLKGFSIDRMRFVKTHARDVDTKIANEFAKLNMTTFV